MRQHCDNALELARRLESRRGVKSVRHPFLPSHPQHELAKRQQRGFGGIVSIVLKGGFEAAKRFCEMEGLSNVAHLSTFRHPEFMKAWGVAFAEGPMVGLTVRAVREPRIDRTALRAAIENLIARILA